MSQTRQLAAIMFTDIVGYTALMGNDEHKAFAILNKNRALQKPIIEQFNGRWIKELGDGVMASFPTVSDAVNAAMKIQEACNASKEFQLRIGIHQGEVVFENEDVFGDGVNVAARIQAAGIPGSILFSKKVNDEIKNKSEFKTISLGNFNLKNVNEPVEVFALANEGLQVPKGKGLTGKLEETKKRTQAKIIIGVAVVALFLVVAGILYKKYYGKNETDSEEIKIAVLPFENLSTNKEGTGAFCEIVPWELQRELGSIRGLILIAPQSMEKYRDTTPTDAEISNALGGVKYIVRGKAQREQNKIKVFVSLIEAISGKVISREEYSGNMEDLFTLQENMAEQIAKDLRVKISPEEKSQIGKTPSKNGKVLDDYIEAQTTYQKYAFSSKQADSDFSKIQILCKSMLAKDSNMADALVIMAKAYVVKYTDGNIKRPQSAMDSLKFLSQKAIDLDNNSADALIALSQYYNFMNDQKKSYENIQKAFAINPNHLNTIIELSSYYFRQVNDESEKAIRFAKRALILDPQSVKTSSAYISLYWAYMNLCDFVMAEHYAQMGIHQDINTTDKGFCLWLMGHLNMVLGKPNEVIKYANEYLKYSPNGLYQIGEVYGRFKGDWKRAAHIYDSLWKTQPDHQNPNRYANALWKTGNKKKALKILDSLITIHRNSDPLDGFNNNYDMAGVLAFRGYKEDAYKILRSPPENTKVWGFGAPYLIQTDPLFESLRNDREFKELFKKAIDEIGIRREKIRKMEDEGKL